MRRCLPLLACAILTAAASAQERQTIENASGALTFDRGVLVGARNKLTGETYTTGRRADRLTGLLRGAEQTPEWADAGGSGPNGPGGIIFEARLGENDTLATTVRADGPRGDFVVRQTGHGEVPGLAACQWGAAGLSDEQVSLIVPAWSGIRLGRGSPAVDTYLEWPSVWEARMVIAQGRQGGLWIHAEDPDDRFKGLYVRHRAGLFDLGLRTCNEAPLAEQRAVESVVWRIGFYRGDWRVPARLYRDWMARTSGATTAAKRKPAWADGIRSVVILPTGRGGGQDEARAVLQKLTEWITPGRTLLYTPDWRRDGYDLNYPDYTAHDGYRELVQSAHRLGYRVMPHTCYYGASLDNPDYERLKPSHLRDLRGTLITYLWEFADPAPRIAMLHPGARAWRELYVARCRAIAEQDGADAIHLDVSLSMPQVLERADGLNTIQGNVAFHRDLRAALPEVALGGEGLNEVSCREESFAQVHAGFTITRPGGGPALVADEDRADCSHPISAYLLLPYTKWYGYLGYPPPDAAGPYRAWTRAYESYGVVPTLANPTLRALKRPGPDLRVRLEEMRVHDRLDLRPDFDARAAPDDKCVWRGAGSRRLVYSRDPEGGSRATLDGRTLYRYVRGRTTVRGTESPGPWPAFDDEGIYGLDPARTWLLEPRPRDSRQPHLLRLPDDVVVRGFRWSADALVFDLARQIPRQDLLRAFASARAGIVVDGREQPVGERAVIEEAVSTCGGVTRPGLFAHPPWTEEDGVTGSVFAEWTVTPRGPAPVLVLDVGLRDGAEKGDGVTFSIAADGMSLWRQDWKRCAWLPVRLDLAPYAGREVKLRLAVEKGPEGRGSYCWAAWGEPRIEADAGPRELTVDLLAPARAVAAAGPGADAAVTPGSAEHGLQRHRVTTSIPGATCVLFRRPEPAALPLDLRLAPFTWTPVAGGMPLPAVDRPGYLTAVAGEGRSGGMTRPALVTHPPSDGFTAIDYVVTLPRDTPAELRFSCALQEGAKSSNGVAFLVAVNGREVSRQEVTGPDGWHDGRVDLRAYAGKTVLLSLIVDALGDAVCDWARWAEPRIVAE